MKINPAVFTFISLFALIIMLGNRVLGEQKEIQDIEGKIVCVEIDNDGNVKVIEQYTECNGELKLVGNDGKIYSLTGKKDAIYKQDTTKENIKLSGQVSGNQRAWILDVSPSDSRDLEDSESKTIKGDVYCLLPYSKKPSVRALMSSDPCNELPPHSHVIKTKDENIYSVVGSEEKIGEIEKNPKDNVLLKGKVRANESGILLYVF